MTTWSGVRTRVEERLADTVRRRVRLQVTRYRGAHDAEGRWAMEIDGVEVGGLGCLSAHAEENALTARLGAESGDSPATVQPEALRRLRADGHHRVDMFHESVKRYLQMSVAAALASDDALVRSLALLDRRLGKRRLQALRESPPTQPMELACLRLRLEAEGLPDVETT